MKRRTLLLGLLSLALISTPLSPSVSMAQGSSAADEEVDEEDAKSSAKGERDEDEVKVFKKAGEPGAKSKGKKDLDLFKEAGEAQGDKGARGTKKEPALRTQIPDQGMGRYSVTYFGEIPQVDRREPWVDERSSRDPMGSRLLLMPTALTPDKGHVAYTNYFFFGHQLDVSPTDDLWLATNIVVPSFALSSSHYVDFMANLRGKYTLSESRDYSLGLMSFAMYRAGQLPRDTAEFGAGLGLLMDLFVSDFAAFTFGAIGYLPFWARREYRGFKDGCGSRNDFIEGRCFETDSVSGFPSGGQWGALYLGLTLYGHESLSLKTEFISGFSNGTVLDQEHAVEHLGEDQLIDRRPIFEGDQWRLGFPYNRPLTIGTALQYTNGGFAAQVGLHAVIGDTLTNHPDMPDGIIFRPMFTVGYAF